MTSQKHDSLNSIIEQYIAFTNPKLSSTDTIHDFDKISNYSPMVPDFSQALNDKGISFRYTEDDDSFDYELILPTTISELNRCLNLPKWDQILDGMDMYFPPNPIIDILDKNALNAGLTCVEERRDKSVSIKCEHYGHAIGFLRFYSNNMYQNNK